jgi:uncharacterized protein YigA (DUF484 family)
MKDIDTIKKKNEELAQQFIAIETALASFTEAKELFEKILVHLEETFAIPFVWISMINRQDLPGAIHDLTTSKILKYRLNIIEEGAFRNLIAHGTKPMLVNRDLKTFYRLLPLKKKYFIRSLAVVPITLHNEIIGSLNLGDSSNLRYQPEMDTTLLQRLASKISSRLSEIIPRDKTADTAMDEACNTE